LAPHHVSHHVPHHVCCALLQFDMTIRDEQSLTALWLLRDLIGRERAAASPALVRLPRAVAMMLVPYSCCS
jgi:hypothetical protein